MTKNDKRLKELKRLVGDQWDDSLLPPPGKMVTLSSLTDDQMRLLADYLLVVADHRDLLAALDTDDESDDDG